MPEPLDPLTIHRYRAHFLLRRQLQVPAPQLGVILRGAFGMTLRELVCHDMNLACSDCPLRKQCAYPAVFEPGARQDKPAIARMADPPRPFVIRPTAVAVDGGASRELTLDLHLVGEAHLQAMMMLVTLQKIADRGIGRDRIRMKLTGIEALDASGQGCAVALDPAMQRLSAEAPAIRAREMARPGDADARRIRIRYLTPTLLREEKAMMTEPNFGVLIKRLRARLGALATMFCEGPIEDDPREVATRAGDVKLCSQQVEWFGAQRRSTRTGQTHPLEGLMGEAVYEGDLGVFLPMLRVGELLHVGKHATFGLGRIEVEVVDRRLTEY